MINVKSCFCFTVFGVLVFQRVKVRHKLFCSPAISWVSSARDKLFLTTPYFQVLQDKLGVKCFLGLTATATLSTASDVSRHIKITDFRQATIRGSPIPDNLYLSVSRDENRDEVSYNIVEYCISSVIRQSFSPSKTIPKNLDPSYKMHLDFWDSRKVITCMEAKFHRTDLVICSHSREEKNPAL